MILHVIPAAAMHITDISAVYPRYSGFDATNWRKHLWQVVVRVTIDSGQVGYGYGGGGKASLPIINGHFRELLVGQPINGVADIATIWDSLHYESLPYGRKGIAIMALSGVDLALWDALAKAENTTVAQLIGKVDKPSVNIYATGPDSEWYAELGVAGQKLTHRWNGKQEDYETAINAADSARQTLGRDKLLMFDVYMSWDETVTERMAALLQTFDIYWFEDVLTPDDYDRLAKLRPVVKPVNLAGGEHEFGVKGFVDAADAGAYDIWQPDITWCGGITAGIRIANLASRHGIKVIPHRGGEVWGLHLIAASQHCEDLAELVLGSRGSQTQQIWHGQPELNNGKLEIRDEPGFGVAPNEELLSPDYLCKSRTIDSQACM